MGAPRDGGVLFEACDQSPYKSLDTHRSTSGTKHPKSIWNPEVSRAEECHTFCGAKLQEWHDKNGDCWAIARDGSQIYKLHVLRLDLPGLWSDGWLYNKSIYSYGLGTADGMRVRLAGPCCGNKRVGHSTT